MATYDSGLVYCTGYAHSGSGSDFTNPDRITANDNSYATRVIGSGSYVLIFATFSSLALASLPDLATVTGIEVYVGRKASREYTMATGSLDGATYYPGVYLYNGPAYGSGRPITFPAYWTTSEAQEIHGGVSDLWGMTITPSILKSGNFKVRFACTSFWGATTTASIDYIAVRIYATYSDDFVPTAAWF